MDALGPIHGTYRPAADRTWRAQRAPPRRAVAWTDFRQGVYQSVAACRPDVRVDRELVEWDYSQYEGRRTAEIRKERPDWELFRDGCPGGESPAEVAARADRVVSRVRAVPGDVLLFSSGHFIRVLATRWIGLEVTANAKRFMLSTASLSAVGYENELSRPVIRLWNDTHYVGD